MTWKPAARLALFAWTLGLVAGCGSGGSEPVAPPPPTATAKPTATETAAPEPPPLAELEVDLLESRHTKAPKKLPGLKVDSPGSDARIGSYWAPTTRLRFQVTNFKEMPEGSFIQFILDNRPFRKVTDPTEKILLKDLAADGELTTGEHLLVAYVAFPNGEGIKQDRAVAVRRFWIQQKTPSKWYASRHPLLVIGQPYDSYEGEAANTIMVDFYIMNAVLSEKEYSISFEVRGPGVKDEVLTRNVSDWVPLMMLRARTGEYTVKATLMDPQGEPVECPWCPTERKITVKRTEEE